jgi:hypothetical protein
MNSPDRSNMLFGALVAQSEPVASRAAETAAQRRPRGTTIALAAAALLTLIWIVGGAAS